MAELDRLVFLWINSNLVHPALDSVMPWIADLKRMLWVLIPAAIWIVVRGGFRWRLFLLCALLGLSAGEGLVLNPLKQAVGRPRPWQAMEGIRHYRDGEFRRTPAPGEGVAGRSFPSSHAANNTQWPLFAILIWGFRRCGWLLIWTAAMALSRVYTGDHYPVDVLAGVLLAALYTVCLAAALQKAWTNFGGRLLPDQFRAHPVLFLPRSTATG
jgi:undecaprenyl-diphosphatase